MTNTTPEQRQAAEERLAAAETALVTARTNATTGTPHTPVTLPAATFKKRADGQWGITGDGLQSATAIGQMGTFAEVTRKDGEKVRVRFFLPDDDDVHHFTEATGPENYMLDNPHPEAFLHEYSGGLFAGRKKGEVFRYSATYPEHLAGKLLYAETEPHEERAHVYDDNYETRGQVVWRPATEEEAADVLAAEARARAVAEREEKARAIHAVKGTPAESLPPGWSERLELADSASRGTGYGAGTDAYLYPSGRVLLRSWNDDDLGRFYGRWVELSHDEVRGAATTVVQRGEGRTDLIE